MSQFGASENFSGNVEGLEINTSKPNSTGTKGKQRPKIEWNDRSYKSFQEIIPQVTGTNGLESYWNGFDFNREVMLNFINKCDLRMGPVKSIIHNMVRIRAPEYNDDGEPDKIKEYITYQIRHMGKDWVGRRNVSPDIIEGRYQKYTIRREIGNPKS